MTNKHSLIIALEPDKYEIFDKRIMKPFTYQMEFKDEGGIKGSMVSQICDSVKIKKEKFEFFIPNNVAILLSISKKNKEASLEFYNENIINNIESETDKIKELKRKSSTFCDYIELIQTSIVFAYTSLEAFSNLSIPSNYTYSQKIKNKGTVEKFDKECIEKWIDLKTKINIILPEIYQTKKLQETKLWSHFIKLEKYRHEIIHQKSIDRTEFYKGYFNDDIFKVASSAEKIIQFFYDNQKLSSTNPLWPWVIGEKKEFPVFQADPKRFEVVGNIHEGVTKK
ncbi:hypothetical protein [Salinimicrobium flavum]|uniref:RiboL-PSP-HEPN domain-containing protein n=1 Tax=Salinimicrobium flavum TaxID=1737065 RepID=A0ABW5IWA3_9FLAO